MICPQNIFFNLTAIVKFTPSIVIGWNKNRSAMRTCVAYEIELLFRVWCPIVFLLEKVISNYSQIVLNIVPAHQ